MLYDPKWGKPEVKAAPFNFEGLVAWLEKQNPRKTYDYWACNGECLYGQYMASFGISWDESGGKDSDRTPRGTFCSRVYESVAALMPFTFGAALERAREQLVRTSAPALSRDT